MTRWSVKNTRDAPYSHRRSVTLVGVPWTARTSSLVEPTVKEAGTGLIEAAGNKCTLRGEPGQMSHPITRPALKYRRDPPYSHIRSVAQVGVPWMARTASCVEPTVTYARGETDGAKPVGRLAGRAEGAAGWNVGWKAYHPATISPPMPRHQAPLPTQDRARTRWRHQPPCVSERSASAR